MMRDFRQSLRTLINTPGFSLLVVAVFALGIGANTAIFSIVDDVLLKPLPFAKPSQLVAINGLTNDAPDTISYPDFLDWRDRAHSVDRIAGYTSAGATLTGAGDPATLNSALVSPDLFPLLGVPPTLGRTFLMDDDKPGAQRVAILAEPTWTKYFSRDPSVIGRSITLDGDPVIVVGVMPAGFVFPFDEDIPQVWMPVRTSRFAAEWADERRASFVRVIGRLHEGTDVRTVQAEFSGIASALDAQYPKNQMRRVLVRPFQDTLVEDYRLGLVVLLGAVAAVLLIACANIANLLLARGASRRREMAVRLALGASRGQIVRQLLTESLALAIVGGIAGTMLALWGVDVLVRVSPVQIPRLQDAHVDRAALVFTALISIVTGTLSGLFPAFQLSRANPGDSLKDGDRGGSGASGTRTRQGLVVAEMALSIVLLSAAGLLVRSLIELQRVNPGFITERTVVMQLLLPGAQYPDPPSMVKFYRRLHEESAKIPGITSAALSTLLPMSGSNVDLGFKIEGRPVDPKVRVGAQLFSVSPEYLPTLGIPLIKGRRFTDHDIESAPNVVIINEALAAKYWPGEDPLGKRILVAKFKPAEIVGIVGNVKQASLADPPQPQIYAPYEQNPWPFIAVVLKTSASPESAASSLRTMLARVDPMLPAADIRTLDQYMARSVAAPRFTALIVGAFAVFALFLAAFGLFSVMAYAVSQRRREIGIRMALGADAGTVGRLVVGQAVRLGLIGLAIGLAGSLATTRLLAGLLYRVSPADPATFAGVSAMLLLVMLLAAYLPARRATRVDPMAALRAE